MLPEDMILRLNSMGAKKLKKKKKRAGKLLQGAPVTWAQASEGSAFGGRRHTWLCREDGTCRMADFNSGANVERKNCRTDLRGSAVQLNFLR